MIWVVRIALRGDGFNFCDSHHWDKADEEEEEGGEEAESAEEGEYIDDGW